MIRCSFRNAWCQSMSSLAELMLFMSCVGVLFRTIPKQSVLQWWGRRAFRGRKPSARWDWDVLRGARRVKTTQFLIKDNADYWKLYSFERKSETTIAFKIESYWNFGSFYHWKANIIVLDRVLWQFGLCTIKTTLNDRGWPTLDLDIDIKI